MGCWNDFRWHGVLRFFVGFGDNLFAGDSGLTRSRHSVDEGYELLFEELEKARGKA